LSEINFLNSCVNILSGLNKLGLVHNDVTLNNLMIKDYNTNYT